MTKTKLVLIFAACLGLSFLLYANTILGDFVYDDELFSQRLDLRKPSDLVSVWAKPYLPENITNGVWRPLTTFSFALNFVLFGDSPASFHVVNIILNGLAVFLVYLFVFDLFKNRALALVSAFLFAILPIHTSAVAYIKSRDEILAAIFILLGWRSFLKATNFLPKIAWRHAASSAIFVFLAMLSKEQAILVPAFYLILFLYRHWRERLKVFILGLIYLPLSGIYFLCRFKILDQYALARDHLHLSSNQLENADFWISIWTAGKIAFLAIGKTLIPINLSSTYVYNQLPL